MSRDGHIVGYGFLTIIILAMVMNGYMDPQKPSEPAAKTVTSPPAPAPPQLKTFMIYPFDMVMRRSSAFRIDGDLRPIWNVSGRIRNNSEVEVKSVSIRIEVMQKITDKLGNTINNVMDSATLKIDTDIPSGSVASFERTIQLMPPNTGWNWDYDVVDAK